MLRNGRKDEAMPPRMLKVTEVAHLLHVHPNTIRLWSKIGVLKAYRIGKRRDYRFRLDDVETFLHRDGSSPD
jgi:excisionase family DNA binding protein